MSRRRVLVVGAGPAGLVLARELAIADAEVTVLEAGPVVGGRLAPVSLAGIEVDGAAEAFPARGGAVAALAARLGLELVAPAVTTRWLVRAEREALPLPEAALLGIPSVPAEAIALIGPRAALRAQLDGVIPMLRPGKYRDLGGLVRRRMGRAVLDELVAPVVRGRYGLGPAELPIDAALPRLRAELARRGSLGSAVAALLAGRPEGGAVAGLRGGVHGLVARLAEHAARVGVELRTNARVAEIDPAGLRLADGERLDGEVVLATPRSESRPGRPPTIAIVAVDSAELDAAPRGRGAFVAAEARGIAARALTHSSARWPWMREELPAHRHVLRLVYDEAPEDPVATVAADLRAITGVRDAGLVDLALRRWDDAPMAWPGATASIGPRGDLAAAVEAAMAAAADLTDADAGTA